MKLSNLFHVRNGIASSNINILPIKSAETVPFIRPASTQQRTISGWVNRSQVAETNIYPEGSLFVSTNGEGSHTYAYVSTFEFIPNSDVSVLIPRFDMTIQEKLFYAKCITMNRYRFSYGRKPKGNRLKSIELPDVVPSWIETLEVGGESLNRLEQLNSISIKPPATAPKCLIDDVVKVRDIFNISYGNKLDLNKMTRTSDGVGFVARTSKNNGVVATVEIIDEIEPYPSGLITVALGGSVLSSFVHLKPFYTAQNVAVLSPKDTMSVEELIFYCTAIQKNAFRFNACGREANRFLKDLAIPARKAIPIWVYGGITRVSGQIKKMAQL